MSKLNRIDHYEGRVRYAAEVISKGMEANRAFDNCFENGDGVAVGAAIYRRSLKNPRIAANMGRYLEVAQIKKNYEDLLGQSFKAAAAAQRAAKGYT